MLLDFYTALREVAKGEHITRRAWNDPNIFVYLDLQGNRHLTIQWGFDKDLILTYEDIVANDWMVLQVIEAVQQEELVSPSPTWSLDDDPF